MARVAIRGCEEEAQRKGIMSRRQRSLTIVLTLVAIATTGATLFAEETNAPPANTIDQKLEQLDQEIRALKHQRELDQEQAQQQANQTALTAKQAPVVTAGADGFAVKSADSNFVLRIHGYVQTDARFYLDDSANKLTDTFLARRVRPILEGTLFRDFDFRIMTDFGNGAASANLLQDAYLEWRYWPWLKVRAGKYKPPVGLERLQSAAWVTFAERGLPTDLVPNRDVGFQLSGDLFGGVVNYAVGVFNGVVDGGIADLDTWDAKDGAARVFIQPFRTTDIGPLQGLGFGVGGTMGDQQATSTTTNLATYKTTGQNTFFTFRSGVAPDGIETRVTPQGYYYWGPLGLLSEYVLADQELRAGTVRDHVRNTAWQIEGTFVLTGENASYNGVSPRRPFDLSKGGWGAFEIVARYGDLRIDPSAFSSSPTALRFANPTTSAQEAREWGVGLNWYLNRNVKLVLNYEQTEFDGGAGAATATAYTVENRPIERFLVTRAQFSF